MNRAIVVNGPEPTGCGFVNVAGSATFDQMCCGITMAPFSVDGDELRVGRLQVDDDLRTRPSP